MRIGKLPLRIAAVLGLVAMVFMLGAAPASAGGAKSAQEVLSTSGWQQWWDTQATRRSLELGGLRMSKFPGLTGRVAEFTGKGPGVLASGPLDVKPGGRYQLVFQLRREDFRNSHYMGLNLFGREIWLDSQCIVGGWQDFSVIGTTPAKGPARIIFRNDTTSKILLQRVHLKLVPAAARPGPANKGAKMAHFPFGAYLGGHADLGRLQACGLDLVICGGGSDPAGLLAKAAGHGIRVILFAPREPREIAELAAKLRDVPAGQRPLYFYLRDEPEIRSYPVDKLMAARKALIKALPWARVATAMVRPGQVARYAEVYDAVFMDQYPVPNMPLTWMADSITQAKAQVRPGGQVWGVVQAFGGGKFTSMGWPRKPSQPELDVLAASALTSGAQGLLFYAWRFIASDAAFKSGICHMVKRLRALEPWLPLRPGLPKGLSLKLLGRVRLDPGGGPAVRTGWGRSARGRLILAVNTMPWETRLSLSLPQSEIKDLWSGRVIHPVGGELRLTLEPMGVRAWLLPGDK